MKNGKREMGNGKRKDGPAWGFGVSPDAAQRRVPFPVSRLAEEMACV
jgi:hypothetical protein